MLHLIRSGRLLVMLCCVVCPLAFAAEEAAAPEEDPAPFPGKKIVWHGFDRYEFKVNERTCYMVVPMTVAEGKPWIWRARFFGHRPEVDLALLEKGFHVAYMDVANLFGSPKAVAHWNVFYAFLTTKYGFNPKPALEGMSRGGLMVFNWGIANPDKVACIYADAPVCDFKSWPGGKGTGAGSPEAWDVCLKAYEMTDEQAVAYPGNPIDNLEPLAKAKVPLFHVSGDADTVVPMSENTAIVEERYKALDAPIKVVVKPDIAHKHGLDDPTPLINFVLKYAK
ncbi:MAG: prolyl oligopeptidase family serine peptidase [bacterium]|nr:prolyl oligopeptidase family serine peptidase [bacterium]